MNEPVQRSRWRIVGPIALTFVVGFALVIWPLSQAFLISTNDNGSLPPIPRGTQAQINLIERETSALRGLAPLKPVRVHFLSSPTFTKRISAVMQKGNPPSQLQIGDTELVLSGLVPESTNLGKVVSQGLPSQVAGWYDYQTKQLYIRDTGQALGIDRWYIAHEYTHALQDQHFGLAKVQPDQSHWKAHNSDAYLAEHSLVEGDAVDIQNAYFLRFYSQAEKVALARQEQRASPGGQSTPRVIQEQFDFPYTDGPTYVTHLLNQGGYPAVNRAFRDPPQTTYQLMFPGGSVSVRPIRLHQVLGRFRSWHRVDDDVNGAFGYQQLVELHVSAALAGRLAELWRGDRYLLLRHRTNFAMFLESVYANSSATGRRPRLLRIRWRDGLEGCTRSPQACGEVEGIYSRRCESSLPMSIWPSGTPRRRSEIW